MTGRSDTHQRDGLVKYAVYVLLGNRENAHDLRYLGQVDAPEGNSHADSHAQEKAVDELVEKITQSVPRSSEDPEPDPWTLLPFVLGKGTGADAYESVVLWPTAAHRQVNRPGKRPLRLGWMHGQNPMAARL